MKYADIKVGGEYRFWIGDPKSLFRAKVSKKTPKEITFHCEPMFGPTFDLKVPPNQVDHEVKPKKKPKPKPKRAG